MGGGLAYFLANDILQSNDILPPIKLVVFGAPRVGDQNWVNSWNKLLVDYRAKHGFDSFHEFSIKGYNDGMTLHYIMRLCTSHPTLFRCPSTTPA
jgi:Lipase (class 3)